MTLPNFRPVVVFPVYLLTISVPFPFGGQNSTFLSFLAVLAAVFSSFLLVCFIAINLRHPVKKEAKKPRKLSGNTRKHEPRKMTSATNDFHSDEQFSCPSSQKYIRETSQHPQKERNGFILGI